MREFKNYRQVNSLQRITPDGEKKFLPGGKAKGSVFFIGPMLARERWLVEGYATGLVGARALRENCIARRRSSCASPLATSRTSAAGEGSAAEGFRLRRQRRERRRQESAAEETGLPWCMAPEQGMDANDCAHGSGGARAGET
jgi:hypothetical protein